MGWLGSQNEKTAKGDHFIDRFGWEREEETEMSTEERVRVGGREEDFVCLFNERAWDG